MSRSKNYNNKIEVPVVAFAVSEGVLKVLLLKNETEPYKGYWKLPSEILESGENIEVKASEILDTMAGLNNVVISQANVYYNTSAIISEDVIHISYLGMVNTVDAIYNRREIEDYESNWFDIDTLPKICYNHQQIIEDSLKIMSHKLSVLDNVKVLFPSDFTLPEIQKVYEQVLKKELDRRNFRKRIINLLEDTGEKFMGKNGRPAKLYRFKEEKEPIFN